jgi:hypothetical protein
MIRVDSATGQLTQIQELGALRNTLLTTGSFDPTGTFLYASASLGNELVWLFRREQGGLLTVVVNPTSEGSAVVGPPQGSYAATVAVNVPPIGGLIFVAVEKDNLVYAGLRNATDGRIRYFPGNVGQVTSTLVRGPTSFAFDPQANVLYIGGDGDNSIVSFQLRGV